MQKQKLKPPPNQIFVLVGFFFNVVIVYIELLFEFGVTHITQGQSTRWQCTSTCCFPRSARNAADSVNETYASARKRSTRQSAELLSADNELLSVGLDTARSARQWAAAANSDYSAAVISVITYNLT